MPSSGTTGIALSGGGIRAASFGLGAVQELHARRSLLRGTTSANWLSAVSGGSYIAGAITLINAGSNASYTDGLSIGGTNVPKGESPVSIGVVKHLIAHSRYLVEDGGWRLLVRFAVLLIASALTFGVLITWLGTMFIGDLGAVGVLLLDGLGIDPIWVAEPWLQWALGLAGVGWLFIVEKLSTFRSLPLDADRSARLKRLAVLALLLPIAVPLILIPPLATMPMLIARLESVPLLRSPEWVAANAGLVVLIVVGALVVTVGLNALSVVVQAIRPVAALVTLVVARALTWGIGLLLICWGGLFVFRLLQGTMFAPDDVGAQLFGLAVFFGVLTAAVLIIPVPGLISPHRPYRTLLAREFAIRRLANGDVEAVPRADEIALSSLLPTAVGPRYPALLICAAANFTDVGATPAGANVLPFVIAGDVVSVPTDPRATIRTTDLEAMKAPRRGFGIVRPRPMMSLASAVAIAGAAVSPAMGRMTVPTLRPILTALNLRLGVWLPNPLVEASRRWAAEHKSGAFNVGVDQLVGEFFGWHSSKNSLAYTSDGGHYENLAIIELLRRKCTTIWAVDSSNDRAGRCTSLAQLIRLAHSELDCTISLDLGVFAARDPQGRPVTTNATAHVRYADGSKGVIHIVRLGLTAEHSSTLVKWAQGDRGFPHHSTLYQIFGWERFDSYRLLGQETMGMLIDRLDATPTP